eukprot:6736784-Pyramimonas_sp.AAC.1
MAEEEVEREMNERISERIAAKCGNETEWRCEGIERLGICTTGGSTAKYSIDVVWMGTDLTCIGTEFV